MALVVPEQRAPLLHFPLVCAEGLSPELRVRLWDCKWAAPCPAGPPNPALAGP